MCLYISYLPRLEPSISVPEYENIQEVYEDQILDKESTAVLDRQSAHQCV